MVKEAYCSFEVSKLLREKGFVQETLMAYNQNGNFMPNGAIEDTYQIFYPAPTHQVAMAWLREVHNIIIEPESVWNGKKWEYQLFVVTPQNADSPYYEHNPYKSYEECIEAALKYVLENLI